MAQGLINLMVQRVTLAKPSSFQYTTLQQCFQTGIKEDAYNSQHLVLEVSATNVVP